MCCPSALGFLTSESDVNPQGWQLARAPGQTRWVTAPVWEHPHQAAPRCAPFSPGAASHAAAEGPQCRLSSGASLSLAPVGTVVPFRVPPEAVTSKGVAQLCTGCVWGVGIPTSEWESCAALEMQVRRRWLEVSSLLCVRPDRLYKVWELLLFADFSIRGPTASLRLADSRVTSWFWAGVSPSTKIRGKDQSILR